jgi:hypothetical protein
MHVNRQPFDFGKFCEAMATLMPCQHPKAAPRLKIKAGNGAPYYRRQCPDCGAALSSHLKFAEVDVYRREGEMIDWDESLYQKWLDRRFECSAEIKEKFGWESGGWWKRYNAYLLSDEWRELRRRVMTRDRFMCRKCEERPAQQVHHLHYERTGHEEESDLISVCLSCHACLHPGRLMRW